MVSDAQLTSCCLASVHLSLSDRQWNGLEVSENNGEESLPSGSDPDLISVTR